MGRAVLFNTVKVCLLFAIVASLAGCGGKSMQNLKSWVATVKQRRGGYLPPLPSPKHYAAYAFADGGMRSPFLPANQTASNTGVKPNFHRHKQYLEQFPLDSLKMVGEIDYNHTRYALIKDPQGLVTRVTIGNYMGQNNGRIVKITSTEIHLIQIVPNGTGGWVRQPASLSLESSGG